MSRRHKSIFLLYNWVIHTRADCRLGFLPRFRVVTDEYLVFHKHNVSLLISICYFELGLFACLVTEHVYMHKWAHVCRHTNMQKSMKTFLRLLMWVSHAPYDLLLRACASLSPIVFKTCILYNQANFEGKLTKLCPNPDSCVCVGVGGRMCIRVCMCWYV